MVHPPPAEAMYTNQEIPETLIERLRCQKGSDRLDLSLCNISKIPVEHIQVYFGTQPHSLDLSYNAIRYISPRFTVELRQVTKLDLSRNQIKKLPDNFGNMRDLVYLDLHQNKLETLPLSMGEMARLQYLRVSEYPFRAPLKDFLGQHGHVSGVALAELLVAFLKEISGAHVETARSGSVSISALASRSSHVHYRKRCTRTQLGTDELQPLSSSSEIEGADQNNNVSYDRSFVASPPPKKGLLASFLSHPTVKLLLLIALWTVAIPILIAYFMDAAFIENLVKDRPILEDVWTKYYKPVHELAAPIAGYFPRSERMYLRGPPPTLFQSNKSTGFFGKPFAFIGGLFGYS